MDTQISVHADSEATTAQLDESSMDTTMCAADLRGPSQKRSRRETTSISIDRLLNFSYNLLRFFV